MAGAPVPPPRPIVVREILDLPYYHPDVLSMQEVLYRLSSYKNVQGHFILRNSFSKPGCFTISVTHASGIKHFSVEMTNAQTYFLKDVYFNSMDKLVSYYSVNEVPNKEKISNVRLLFPVLRSDPRHSLSSSASGDYIVVCSTPDMEHIRDPSSMFNELMKNVKLNDDQQERCDCGLLIEDSLLPRGWSVHVSKEPQTMGEIYFKSPDGQSHWVLPLAIALELTPVQQDRIRDLLFEFERKMCKTPKAKMADGTQNAIKPTSPLNSPTDNCHEQSQNSEYVQPNVTVVENTQCDTIISLTRSSFYPSITEDNVRNSDSQKKSNEYMSMDAHLKKK